MKKSVHNEKTIGACSRHQDSLFQVYRLVVRKPEERHRPVRPVMFLMGVFLVMVLESADSVCFLTGGGDFIGIRGLASVLDQWFWESAGKGGEAMCVMAEACCFV